MAARHICLIASGLILSAATFAPALVVEESEDAAPQVENAKYHFFGRINRNAVEVRSGPDDKYYSTAKLSKDAKIKVVGIKGEWLKIEPPAGSFSYVPAAYVTRRNDGKVGRVNSKLIVRAGSTLNTMKTMPQTQLLEGQDVSIIEETDDGYFKVAPPKGAYVYVHQKFVLPDGPAEPASIASDAKKPDGEEKPEIDPKSEIAENGVKEKGEGSADPITDLPEANERIAKSAEPTSRPAVAAATEDFRALEAEFEAASKLDIAQQPLEKFTERYQTLAKSGAITGTNQRILDARLTALKMRTEARDKLRSFRQSKEEAQASVRDLVEEKKELDARIKQTEVTLYTAVGTMRMSSLQQGASTLYRLTDPTTGRTIVYLRSNDPKYASLINQFVGVRGDLTNDQRLRMKIITPTEAEAVDASKVNTSIIATITPPGMLISTSAAVDQRDTGN